MAPPPPPPPPPPPRAPYGSQPVAYHYPMNYGYQNAAANSTMPPAYNYSNRPNQPPPPPPPPYSYNANYNPQAYSGRGYPMTPQQPVYHHLQQNQHHPAPFPSSPMQPPIPPPPPPRSNPQHTNQRKRKRDNGNNWKQQQPQQSSPRGEKFHCDVCSVSVDTRQAMQSHLASHIPCKFQGCAFQAAPKVVKAHYQSTHGKFSTNNNNGQGSGFKTVTVAIPGCKVQRFRICVGNRPEDVQKWIAERKKRFPRRQPQQQQSNNTTTSTSNVQKANPPTGVSALLDGYGSSSDDECEETSKEKQLATNVKGDAESTTVSTADEVKNTPNDADVVVEEKKEEEKHDVASTVPGYRTKICRYFARFGKCRHGDSCTFLHEGPDNNNSAARQLQSSHASTTRQQAQLQRRRRSQEPPKSLLRSLLAKDIQRESTLTLQLLRYIVDQNFFQKEENTARADQSGEDATSGDHDVKEAATLAGVRVDKTS